MKTLVDVLNNINMVAFSVLAVACAWRMHRRNDRSMRWATVAFGSLAAISLIGFALKQAAVASMAMWFIKGLLVVLLLFPYFLYRFAVSFQRPGRFSSFLAHVATGAAIVATFLLPSLPYPGMPEPNWLTAYRMLIVVQWTILFSAVGARLWAAARRENTTGARRRLILLALATAGMNAAILLSGVAKSPQTETMQVITASLALGSAILFFAGLAPPAWLLDLWRRPEGFAFQAAMGAMLQAETQKELSDVLLPRAAALVGASGAVLVLPSGEVLGRFGTVDDEDRIVALMSAPLTEPMPSHVQAVKMACGTLLVWTSSYTSFFAQSDLKTLEGLGVFADIAMERCALAEQQRRAERELSFQATHDHLTGLPNRTLLEDRVSQALARAKRSRESVMVLFIDVDRFKVINDSLGHASGDEVLQAVAARLQSIVRPEDTVARFGGDEFVVVTHGVSTTDGPKTLADRIAKVLTEPISIDGTEVVVTASIGAAVADDDTDAGKVLRDADSAMYRAKHGGRDRWVLFDAAMRETATRRLEVENALRRAIDSDQIAVYYQPVIEVESGRMVGVEALARWSRAGEVVMPSEFIPIAEETGLINALGASVLREACRQAAEWQATVPGMEDLSLSVNLSARELLTPDVADSVRRALAMSGLDPGHLCLEITESVILGDAEASGRALAALKELGVRLGIDDFGTGYSALTYLKQFPVDTLKIDQSFVEGLDGHADHRGDRAIVAGLIDLAHAFGLTTVAEGVETAEQLSQLHSLGCELAQGYSLGRPMPAAEATRWMRIERVRAGEDGGRSTLVPRSDLKRVLVVEDDSGLRTMVRLLLEDQFNVVGEAPGGREAVALARHYQPDIVLLDLAMPGVGGLEALPLIRAVAPDAKVVVFSGLDPHDIADEAMACGAVGFVHKGDPDELVNQLNQILSVAA